MKKKDSEESDLEKEVSRSDKKEEKLDEEDNEKEDFEIQQNFIESSNSIESLDFSEPILERIRMFNPDNIERGIFTTSFMRFQNEEYDEKYKNSNYFENKYDKKIPDYTSKFSSDNEDVKEKSDADSFEIR